MPGYLDFGYFDRALVTAAPAAPGATGPGLLTFGGPTGLAAGVAPDLMALVVAWLRADPAVVAALGDSGDAPKIWADETAPRNPDGSPIALPWLVYSEPGETVTRVMGGTHVGRGTFEVGAWAGTKAGARALLDVVTRSVNAMTVPRPVGGVPDSLVFIRSQDNSGRPLPPNAPGAAVTEFGRAVPFNYLITRTDT